MRTGEVLGPHPNQACRASFAGACAARSDQNAERLGGWRCLCWLWCHSVVCSVLAVVHVWRWLCTPGAASHSIWCAAQLSAWWVVLT